MTTTYPRFLGVDGSGDFVWELDTGRWTWGETPYDAAKRERTFEPARYIEKYGRPVGLEDKVDRKAEAELDPAELDPAELAAQYVLPETREAGVKLTAWGVLQTLHGVLDGWIEGARANHDGLDHRGEPVGDECWTRYAPADIRNMINDAARELGLAEIPAPAKPKEDEVR